MIKKFLIFSIMAVLFAASTGVDACAMCTDSTGFSEKSRQAYYIVTVLLLAIPVSVGLAIIYFVRKKKDP